MQKHNQALKISGIVLLTIFLLGSLIGTIFYFTEQTAFTKSQDLMLAKEIPLPVEPAYDPKKLIEDDSPMVKLSSPTPNPIFITKQKVRFAFVKQTFFDPSLAVYCCDSTDLIFSNNQYSGYCSYQCSGTFEYCDGYCNPRTENSCPSGYVLVNNNHNCCPSSQPYYKA